MSIQSNTPKRFDTMDRNSQRLCWLLDMHGVELSWPEGLPPFVRKLQTDRHLAIDFWALVRSLQRNEAAQSGGQLGDQQILALVISCVCGSNPLPWSHDDKAALAELTSMLAGSASSTDAEANLPDALFVPEPVQFPPLATEWLGTHNNELHQADVADDALRAPRFSANPGRPQPAPAFEVSHAPSYHLNEALSRLELTSLELKHHLNNLDSRMSRIEPHLEDISTLVATTLGNPPANGSKPAAPNPEVSLPDASMEQEVVGMHHAVRTLTSSEEPDIFFRDRRGNWWPTSPLTDFAAKAKTAWANLPQWKRALPGLPPHLLPELKQRIPELKQLWLDSTRFVSSRLPSINRRQVVVVASIVVGAVISGTILVGAYRHPIEHHDTQPREVKAMEQPAEPAAKPARDSNPEATPSAVKSSGNLQSGTQAKTATTPVTPQANTPKKGQGEDYVAKPTFKWLGDAPPDTSARNKNHKTGDTAP